MGQQNPTAASTDTQLFEVLYHCPCSGLTDQLLIQGRDIENIRQMMPDILADSVEVVEIEAVDEVPENPIYT